MSQLKSSELCLCGCNRYPRAGVRGPRPKYFDASCRKRASRVARGETVPSLTMCACGCGELVPGRRKLYFSDACRQRAYRRRKDFDDLGPEFDWSKRPETPRKKDMDGYKVKWS